MISINTVKSSIFSELNKIGLPVYYNHVEADIKDRFIVYQLLDTTDLITTTTLGDRLRVQVDVYDRSSQSSELTDNKIRQVKEALWNQNIFGNEVDFISCFTELEIPAHFETDSRAHRATIRLVYQYTQTREV